MQMLDLDNGSVSLEFSADEREQVLDRLRRLGPMRAEVAACHEVLTVNGESIVYTDEWDEPCLIASTPAAIAMLRWVLDQSRRAQAA